jgi:predicted HTH transcriptional regulator
VLTKRDREIVRWIGRHGAVQAQHVMTRFSIGRTAAYRRLHELVEFGLRRRRGRQQSRSRRRSWAPIAAITGVCTSRISSSSAPAGSR